jgi:hypothetical protein
MGERRDAQEWQGDTNNVNKRDDVYTKLRRRLSVCHQQFLQIKARVFWVRYHCSTHNFTLVNIGGRGKSGSIQLVFLEASFFLLNASFASLTRRSRLCMALSILCFSCSDWSVLRWYQPYATPNTRAEYRTTLVNQPVSQRTQ